MNCKTITLRHGAWLLSAIAAAALTACGGGSGGSDIVAVPSAASSQGAAELATGITSVVLADAVLIGNDAALEAQPTFHLAPVLLDTPDAIAVVFEEESLTELVGSIQEVGLLQPIVVRRSGQHPLLWRMAGVVADATTVPADCPPRLLESVPS